MQGIGRFRHKLLAVQRKGRVEFMCAIKPHLFHRRQPLLADVQVRGPLIQNREQPADDAFNVTRWKSVNAGTDDEVFLKQEYLGVDAGFAG